jgi:hypothetical protein
VNEGATHCEYRFAGYVGAELLRLAEQALESLVSRSCRLFGQGSAAAVADAPPLFASKYNSEMSSRLLAAQAARKR